MPSWYDITGLDERSNENCNGIIESRDKIRSILDDEAENTKLPYHRMVLMGFSQGGALSLFTGMQLPKEKKPAGKWTNYMSYFTVVNLNHRKEDVQNGLYS